MELIKCAAAYMAVNQLCEKEWDYQSAYTLLALKRALQEHASFFTSKEMELAQSCGEKDEAGQLRMRENGSFPFASPEKAEEYQRRRAELAMVQVDPDWQEKTLPAPDQIAPAQLEALEGLVAFEGAET